MRAYIFTYIDICIPYIYFSKMSPFRQAFRLFRHKRPVQNEKRDQFKVSHENSGGVA